MMAIKPNMIGISRKTLGKGGGKYIPTKVPAKIKR